MKELILLADRATLPADLEQTGSTQASGAEETVRVVACWNRWDAPEGGISLPARLYA